MELVAPNVDRLATIYAVESIKGFGPQKFRQLAEANLTPQDVLADPSRLPIRGKWGEQFRADLKRLGENSLEEFRARAERQLERAIEHGAHILVHGDGHYPVNLWKSNNPVPVLYVRGDLSILQVGKAVACVGSRQINDNYTSLQRQFAGFAAHEGFVVVSGFAMGADSVAHRAAKDAKGATVCVMPCGLDRPFPPENRALWREFQEYPGAVLLSEFPFSTAAAALTLRKRNKTIVGLALGVLLGQSSKDGGAMNAYRFAKDQKKRVASFEPDGQAATEGNAVVIADERGTGFPSGGPDIDAWREWLLALSS